MKYVRTKDKRIFKVEPCYPLPDRKLDHYRVLNDKEDIYTPSEIISVDDVIKEADTIEELCDEFVCEWNVYPALCLLLKRVPKDRQKNIYGAIWTDKGLIYVAKMNNEGVLELL